MNPFLLTISPNAFEFVRTDVDQIGQMTVICTVLIVRVAFETHESLLKLVEINYVFV
jgi:hypothetical protein